MKDNMLTRLHIGIMIAIKYSTFRWKTFLQSKNDGLDASSQVKLYIN